MRFWGTLVFLTLVPVAHAQQAVGVKDIASHAKVRALLALSEVQTLKGTEPCPKAVSTVAMENCLNAADAKADRAYHNFVLALGALLRIAMSDPGANQKPMPVGMRMPFDEAETAWLRYRDQSAEQQYDLAQGGTLGPVSGAGMKFSLTLAHVLELQTVYDEFLK